MPYKDLTAHRETKKAYNATYSAEHPEEKKAYNAVYYDTHREEKKARDAVRRAVHLEELRTYNRRYYKDHPQTHESIKLAVERRRARKAGLPATLTRAEWEAIKAAYKHRCAYCGKKESKTQPLTQDHVVPLSKRGGTVRANIVPACRPCNSKKGKNLPANPTQLVLI